MNAMKVAFERREAEHKVELEVEHSRFEAQRAPFKAILGDAKKLEEAM